LCSFEKNAKRSKSKKASKSSDLLALRHFLRLFEKIENFMFSGFSAFPWGEQDSNLSPGTPVYTAIVDFKKVLCPEFALILKNIIIILSYLKLALQTI